MNNNDNTNNQNMNKFDDEIDFSSPEFENISIVDKVSAGGGYNDLDDEYSNVLELTAYDDNGKTSETGIIGFTEAEYNEIKITEINSTQKKAAKSFIDKVANFIKKLDDVTANEEHKAYIEQTAKLQLNGLYDLMVLQELNKKMIENIVIRINSVNADDYSLIMNYNKLVDQHIKLISETQKMISNIPKKLKEMRNDILNESDFGSIDDDDDDNNSYSSSKDLLKNIRDRYSNGLK